MKHLHFYLLILIISISNDLFAQKPYVDTAWVSSSPGIGISYYHTSSIVDNGNLIVTGNIIDGYDTDVYTIKYTSGGDTMWTATENGSLSGGNDYGIDVDVTSSGDVIITAAIENSSTGYDYAIYRYDGSDGSLEWSYEWDGNSGIDIPAKILVADDINKIFVVGGSEASGGGQSDFGSIAIDSSGSFQWENFHDGNNLNDAAVECSYTAPNQYLYVVGGSNQSAGVWATVAEKIKISDGSTYSTSTTDTTNATIVEAKAMDIDSTNNIYITGYGEVGGDKYVEIIKLDSTLNEVWVKTYDNTYDDVGNDIAVDENGNVYVTGYTYTDNNLFQSILLKYNSSGTLIWVRRYGDNHLEVSAKSIKMELGNNHDVFITGSITQDTLESYFFNHYTNDGILLLSEHYESDTLDLNAYDIQVDSNDIYITGLANSQGGSRIRAIKYTLLEDVDPDYFYINGNKYYWCQQPFVYSFATSDSSEITGLVDTSIVLNVDYYSNGMHNVYFNLEASNAEIDSVISDIENDPDFLKDYMAATLTKNNGMTYEEGHFYYTLTNSIEIVFDDEEITKAEAEDFGDSWDLTLVSWPDTSIDHGVFIFDCESSSASYDYYDPSITMDMAAIIWENDSSDIDKIAPGMQMFSPDDPNDSGYSLMWWAENDGTNICGGPSYTSDADIDLDMAWNLSNEFGTGFTWSGQDIVVGVLDYYGYEMDHPDLDNVFFDGYFITSNGGAIPSQTGQDLFVQYDESHLMQVSGEIAANINDYAGIAGVAYNSNVFPCVMSNFTTSTVMIAGLQTMLAQTGAEEVDILNMSFGETTTLTLTEMEGLPLYQAVLNCYEQGRPVSGGTPKGMVLISSSGNNHHYLQMPSAYTEVLKVGATNPQDALKTGGDGYGSWYSTELKSDGVAAPGVCIWTTDFTFSDGESVEDHSEFQGTSAAAPLVSGVAALLLEKNDDLLVEEVYDAIRYNCEKVGGYSYSGSGASSISFELGYGRINAFDALQSIETNEIVENSRFDFYYSNPVNEIIYVRVPFSEDYTIEIIDISGKQAKLPLRITQSTADINVSELSAGIYMIKVTNNETDEISTKLFVKK